MILMPQIFGITANENERYKHDKLEYGIYKFDLLMNKVWLNPTQPYKLWI